MATKQGSRKRIGIRDRLGRLTYRGACRLLGGADGSDGESQLRRGGRFEIDVRRHVYLGQDTLRVTVPDPDLPPGEAVVTMVEMTSKPSGLQLNCTVCETTCDHLAAALGLVLEEKLSLGLSLVPDPSEPLENLTEDELLRRALADRQQRAQQERMRLKSLDGRSPWSDYVVTSHQSGKTYRVALRGTEPGQSYCSCPDFRSNHLGTCKHILYALSRVQTRFSAKQLQQPYRRRNLSLRVDYGETLGLRFNLPDRLDPAVQKILGKAGGERRDDVDQVLGLLRRLERAGTTVHIYPDAEEFIEQRLLRTRLENAAEAIRRDPAACPLRRELLQVELLPYQMDGVAFAVGAGRAVLADDMGLGKTIQGIGVAELLARLADIRRVLVVCPASLKSQWRAEIARATGRSAQIVLGTGKERAGQYQGETFFTICNYEQILRDHAAVERVAWDLIILDEGQRIKNWESRTSRALRSLKSPFALVLSGTPLENRLEELYTVVGFIDDRRLGPAYRFFHRHRVVDERGRVVGYQNLDQLREHLRPLLLRRTRAAVMQELPERTTEIVRIAPTEEQLLMSEQFVQQAAKIAAKRFLTEMDLLRLQKLLLMARMSADSTFLVTKENPSYSSKLERLEELLTQLAEEGDRKIILFSEWTTMLDLISPLLERLQLGFVRLDGSVPQKNRAALVHRFQNDAKCQAILMSNAGSTGLNLQAANTVINVDLPWNPAVLEQRIGRAHRMGQKQPVQVFVLVTEQTIEERMLGILSAKHDLALAALDISSDVTRVELASGMDDLKRRLERLLGNQPAAPVDASMQAEVLQQAQNIQQRRDKVAAAGGELLGAALQLVGELIQGGAPPDSAAVDQVHQGLAECMERDAAGRPQLRVTLPSDNALRDLARTLAQLLIPEPPR